MSSPSLMATTGWCSLTAAWYAAMTRALIILTNKCPRPVEWVYISLEQLTEDFRVQTPRRRSKDGETLAEPPNNNDGARMGGGARTGCSC